MSIKVHKVGSKLWVTTWIWIWEQNFSILLLIFKCLVCLFFCEIPPHSPILIMLHSPRNSPPWCVLKSVKHCFSILVLDILRLTHQSSESQSKQRVSGFQMDKVAQITAESLLMFHSVALNPPHVDTTCPPTLPRRAAADSALKYFPIHCTFHGSTHLNLKRRFHFSSLPITFPFIAPHVHLQWKEGSAQK